MLSLVKVLYRWFDETLHPRLQNLGCLQTLFNLSNAGPHWSKKGQRTTTFIKKYQTLTPTDQATFRGLPIGLVTDPRSTHLTGDWSQVDPFGLRIMKRLQLTKYQRPNHVIINYQRPTVCGQRYRKSPVFGLRRDQEITNSKGVDSQPSALVIKDLKLTTLMKENKNAIYSKQNSDRCFAIDTGQSRDIKSTHTQC